jgi:hypothetical protein
MATATGYRPRPPATDQYAAGHRLLRCTGLLSRSASPPLQLASLRRPESRIPLDRQRSPPVVSTAFLAPDTRFSVTRSPRGPPLRMCPRKLGGASAHSQGLHAHRCALSRAAQRTRTPCLTEHVKTRIGGRAVHGIVPPAFEFQWAQCRGGLPREWPPGEAHHSHQKGRRDARRWPRSHEDDESPMPPPGGEPERRRDKRRPRRKAGDGRTSDRDRFSGGDSGSGSFGGRDGHGHRSRCRPRTKPLLST